MTARKEKKILLIEPPFYRLFKNTYALDRYPLSLGYLAAVISQKTTWEVMAYNADFYPARDPIKVSYLSGAGFDNYLANLKNPAGAIWKEIKSVIAGYNPMVLGISAKSQNFTSACMITRIAKEINKDIIVIIGGVHPSLTGRDVFKNAAIDISVRGEGEDTIIELLNAIESLRSLEGIKGIIYRKNDLLIENLPREYIKDLDSLPFPGDSARRLLKGYAKYPKAAFSHIFTSRGCPYNCFFCSSRNIWNRRVRARSPENVIKEIKALREQGVRIFDFVDDNFGINKEHIIDLCNALIRHCPDIKWSCELHVNLVEEEAISFMKKAGCFLIQIGVESGNNEALSRIRKNITIEKALSAAKIIKKYGIKLQAFFIIGFPWDTEASLDDTVKAMRKIKCDILTYSIFTPYPATEAFEFCKENGLIKEDYDVSLYNHQSPANNFCINIPPRRFRMLASKIERMVDRRNSINRIKRIFSPATFFMIRELGISRSIHKGTQILLGK